jgi:hypothetical protein
MLGSTLEHSRRWGAAACLATLCWGLFAPLWISAQDEPGFVPLLNGESLDGWEGDLSLWKVQGKTIVGDSAGIPHNQFLATRKTYGNFELKLEFRLEEGRGNSGIQFRSKRVADSTEVSGYQADIGEQYWGCLYDESRRNKILAKAPAALDDVLKKNDWNTYTIRAVGPRVTLAINGLTTVDYTEAEAGIAREGVIALQVHSGPPLRVAFRNIRLKELPADSR